MMPIRAECVVVGTGPAGLASALALSAVGIDCVLVGPRPQITGVEARTAALFPSSIELLHNLGVWHDCAGQSERLEAIRIIDDTERLLRAPEVLFSAGELGLESFGFNVPNDVLTASLARRAVCSNRIDWRDDSVLEVRPADHRLTLFLKSGAQIEAKLAVAADGRHSVCREAAGIATRAWSLEQTAIACRFEHARSHDFISTEFHRAAGPLTTVPLPGTASSLVWVDRPAIAERLAQLASPSFAAALEGRLHGVLGHVTNVGPRRLHRLSGHLAARFAQNRVALVGEAGHAFPPIGAQGLNLGLRDAAALAEVVASMVRAGGDPGGSDAMSAYHDHRARDAQWRTWSVGALNESLLSASPLIHLARGAGLHLLKAAPALRRAAMRLGLEPAGSKPRLMQPGGDGLLAA